MKSIFEVVYHPDVFGKDLPSISPDIKKRIKKSIETKLVHAPADFGELLRRSLKGFWKLRVGDYRIIYKISGKTVTVLRIGHRRAVYESCSPTATSGLLSSNVRRLLPLFSIQTRPQSLHI